MTGSNSRLNANWAWPWPPQRAGRSLPPPAHLLPTAPATVMSATLPDHRRYSAPCTTGSTVELSKTRQLRSVVISAVFPPEFTFSATTSRAVAEELVNRGHAVTVLAPFPNRPAGKLFPGYRRRVYSRQQTAQGYALVHCFGTLAPN